MTPELDELSRRYVTLGFGIERHIEGTVDAYVGPPEIRDAALAGPTPAPADLLAEATDLLAAVNAAEIEPSRTDYLSAQVIALQTTCRKLSGEDIAFTDQVREYFDIEPAHTPEEVYDEAARALDAALPGSGDLAERMIAWRAQFEIPVASAPALIEGILAEARSRSAAFAPLPEGEGIEIAMVTDQPWSGYNWYLGNGRSRVEINTDLPVRANALLDLVCHEGYPGHHSEHAIKEMRLYRERGFGEHAIQLINTPECAISEAIATRAESVIFAPEESAEWRNRHLYQPLGITVDPERDRAVLEAQAALRSVSGNAALLLHQDGASEDEVVAYLQRYSLESEERARHRLRFIASPLWGAYVFTYHVGGDLLERWLGTSDLAERQTRFADVLANQWTPSSLLGDLAPAEP